MAHPLCVALAAVSRNWDGGPPDGAMLSTTRAFLARATDDHALLVEVAAALDSYDAGAATWIAVTCGSMVERGAPAELTGPAVFATLRAWLPKLPRWNEESDEEPPAPTPEQAALLELFKFLCPAVVTHLARLPVEREALAQDAQLIERLAELQAYSHGAIWVREALLKTSGTIVFLHAPSRTGARVRYTNVANCFHLFSLLQTAIGTSLPGGRAPDAAIARVARGKSAESVTDEAWWHYGSARSNKADLDASIWGEGLVREIPLVDGTQVIVAWSPVLASRTWSAGFLGPHLEAMPADAVMEAALTESECEAWLDRLGIERGSSGNRKWWRFWS